MPVAKSLQKHLHHCCLISCWTQVPTYIQDENENVRHADPMIADNLN